MAKAGNSLAERLRKLDSALERAKKLKRGQTLSADPMRELVGVSWVQLRKWCDEIAGLEESGSFVRGGNGIEWEFKPARTIKFLIKHFRSQQAKRVEKAREVRRLVGGALDGVPEDVDIDDLRKIIQTSSLLREERERNGELVDARETSQALKAMFAEMQQAGVKAASQQDPTGQWSPEVREAVEEGLNTIMVAMQGAGEKVLRTLRGGMA